MARVVGETRTLAPPLWAKDFGGREHIVPFPAKINAAEFYDSAAVLAKLNGAASGGTNEVQTITIDATGGTFTITFAGQTTGALAYDAAQEVVEAALEGLSTIGDGNVGVTLAALVYTVTFKNALGKQNVAAMTTNAGSLTGGAGTAVVATATPGAAGATSVTVDALSGPIPAGTVLYFGSTGLFARLSAAAATGATTLTVDALINDLADNAEARYSPYGTKYIPSGTLVGRTWAERDANAAFGLATDTDNEIYLTVFDVVDALTENDIELYRHGGVVAENHLPAITEDLLAGNATLLAAVRELYVCINAED